MEWLKEYSYRKKVSISSTTAGTQTNYQMKLTVGESSTTSGVDTNCENRCQNFPLVDQTSIQIILLTLIGYLFANMLHQNQHGVLGEMRSWKPLRRQPLT